MRRYTYAFVLLLVPALLIGAGVWRLLAREQARARLDERLQHERLAEAAAEAVRIAVGVVEAPLLAQLKGLDAEAAISGLGQIRNDNPLVRNVFIYDEHSRRLLLPDPDNPANEEERYFVRRYEPLFAGRVLWSDCGAGVAEEEAPSSLRGIQQLSYAVQAKEIRSKGVAAAEAAGWLVWFADEQLYKVGWVRRGALRYGVELETAMVVAQLTQMLPQRLSPGVGVALLDGNRRLVHQVGARPAAVGVRPAAEQPVGAELPHWAVAVYAAGDAGAAGGRRLVGLGAVFTAALIALILAIGWVLMREAGRNWEEARRKADFVANVSHELKTPLTAIRLHAEMLEAGRVDSEEKRQHYLRVLVGESRRLGRLVDSVLTFSRLERGGHALRLERVSVAEAVAGVCEAARPAVEAAGMRLEAAVEPSLSVQADRDALAQCLHNLIDNAVKYAARGVVRITAEAGGGRARIRVCDDGPGIAAAMHERVFEAFERADNALTAVSQGVGLGLAITRRLASKMAGSVRYEQPPKGGACFVVELKQWTGDGHERD